MNKATVERKALEQALEFVTSKKWGSSYYMDMQVYEDAQKLRVVLENALAPAPIPADVEDTLARYGIAI